MSTALYGNTLKCVRDQKHSDFQSPRLYINLRSFINVYMIFLKLIKRVQSLFVHRYLTVAGIANNIA